MGRCIKSLRSLWQPKGYANQCSDPYELVMGENSVQFQFCLKSGFWYKKPYRKDSSGVV